MPYMFYIFYLFFKMTFLSSMTELQLAQLLISMKQNAFATRGNKYYNDPEFVVEMDRIINNIEIGVIPITQSQLKQIMCNNNIYYPLVITSYDC